MRVLGIGSPFGDDQLGLVAARYMQTRMADMSIDVQALDRPGASLIGLLQDADAVVLIDAVRQSGVPGSLYRLEGQDCLNVPAQPWATHGFGVAAALQLADKLGALPRRLVLYGIEPASLQGEVLSEAVAASLPHLCEQVMADVRGWLERIE